MNINKCNNLNPKKLNEITLFLENNKFNNGISFIENDMNFYEDFPCFFTAYEKDKLIAFMSVFIPDSASCEIYFHLSDEYLDNFNTTLNKVLDELYPLLDEYKISNKYIIFDANTSKIVHSAMTDSIFSHSDCLMKYDLDFDFNIDKICLSPKIEKDNESICIKTYQNSKFIGTCVVETSDSYALIHDVEVKSNHRGLGFGTETLYHTLSYLKNNKYSQILLHVNSANTIAFTMYSHHGFKIIEQIDYYKIIQQSS